MTFENEVESSGAEVALFVDDERSRDFLVATGSFSGCRECIEGGGFFAGVDGCD